MNFNAVNVMLFLRSTSEAHQNRKIYLVLPAKVLIFKNYFLRLGQQLTIMALSHLLAGVVAVVAAAVAVAPHHIKRGISRQFLLFPFNKKLIFMETARQ
ncbi:MAG: hypothetical protein MRJ65_13605 [Candidatus Brocadiaceae bacterium]|nr:hypothetical protein [Candidatus Brocadiaceae bacterium]